MGPGHFAVALASKPFAPKASLWILLAASEALDMLCFGLMAVGIEHVGVTQTSIAHGIRIVIQGSIPWSHGLFMALVWFACNLAIEIAQRLFTIADQDGLHQIEQVSYLWLVKCRIE